MHVIVVDDGSNDDELENALSSYDIELVLKEKNEGFSATVNAGIRLSMDSEYVILLNNDTVVEKDYVEKMVEAMDGRNEIFSAQSKMVSLYNKDKMDSAGDYYCILGWAYNKGKDKSVNNYNKEKKIFSACAGSAIYRVSTLKETGLFDEAHFAYLEDVDIGYRARLMGYKNIYAPKAVCYHAGSGFSGSRHNAFKVKLSSRNNIYLLHKNMNLFWRIVNICPLSLGVLIKYLFFIRKGLGKEYIAGVKEGFALYDKNKGKRVKYAPAVFGRSIIINFWLVISTFGLLG
jgi:GT2 family glycosyltransferase